MGLEHSRYRSLLDALVRILSYLAVDSLAEAKGNMAAVTIPDLS